MAVYTVHQPPPRTAGELPNPERFAFVRDGFYLWAFLLTPLWMLWHRLWLALVIYLVVCGALDAALLRLGASRGLIGLVGVSISLLVGLEGGTLRRRAFGRRGWINVSLVSADDLEDAERRFFEVWVRSQPARHGATAVAAAPAVPVRRMMPPGPDVIGLFPEPGTNS
jgi:hypothetical protein